MNSPPVEHPKERRFRSKLFLQFAILLLIYFVVDRVLQRCDAQKVLESQLIGSPKIQCEESRIRVSIHTNEPFGGNVYAKGFFNKDICRVNGNGVGNSANITIPVNADCGMRRRRIVDPKGLVLEMTIVLMFHPKFLTRNDKAYHIECMYMEISHKVSSRLDVSALPSTQLGESTGISLDSSLPKCKYEVLDKDNNGQALTFATIGQPVYHHWTCYVDTAAGGGASSVDEKLYCLTVHSCEVDDGQGNVQKLLDSNGCPLDKALLDEIDYKSDLEAGRRGYVFKFADRSTVYFGCQLRLEVKSEWKQQCQRTSDKCRVLADLSLQPANLQVKTRAGDSVVSTTVAEDDYPTTADFPLPSQSVTPQRSLPPSLSPPNARATSNDNEKTYLSAAAANGPVPPAADSLQEDDDGVWNTVDDDDHGGPPSSRPFERLQKIAPSGSSTVKTRQNWLRTTVTDAPEKVEPSHYGSTFSTSSAATSADADADTLNDVDEDGADEGGRYGREESKEEENAEEEDAVIIGSRHRQPPAFSPLLNDVAERKGRGRMEITTATAGGSASTTTAAMPTLIIKQKRKNRTTRSPSNTSSATGEEGSGGLVGEVTGAGQTRSADENNVMGSPLPEQMALTLPDDHESFNQLRRRQLRQRQRAAAASAFFDDVSSGRSGGGGEFVDVDVTAPEVDVLDIPQIAMIRNSDVDFYRHSDQLTPLHVRDYLEPSVAGQQICMSRQTLTVSVFLAIALMVVAIGLFSIILYRMYRESGYISGVDHSQKLMPAVVALSVPQGHHYRREAAAGIPAHSNRRRNITYSGESSTSMA